MYKMKKITFKNHPVLGNLSLDFCDKNGDAVDTVIFAGENGNGKTILLNELYKIASHTKNGLTAEIVDVEFEKDSKPFSVKYYYKDLRKSERYLFANNQIFGSVDERQTNKFYGIFSDVEINFASKKHTAVTSSELDSNSESRKSVQGFVTQINQLLIDIQAADDAELAKAVRKNRDKKGSEIKIQERMPRFTNAFNTMFDNLKYSEIINVANHKEILFDKNGNSVSVDDLSSGEKQIIYRGCFLLKDVNALKGAFVFIDEPEISLHPNWQKKIMDYYKGIFTDENGVQTSQIFAVTHSPFIIHNENRRNDKVIVLTRDENGEIIVKDNPKYYNCNSSQVIEDAFAIHDFSTQKATVYLEGITDELYFNKAVDVYEIKDLPFDFKCVGYLDQNGNYKNSGERNLDKAFNFVSGINLPVMSIFLKDCDTNRQTEIKGNAIITSIPYFENGDMKKGIENALVFDKFDKEPFYYIEENPDGNGGCVTKKKLNKSSLCDAICNLDDDSIQKDVLKNVKKVIDNLTLFYDGETEWKI